MSRPEPIVGEIGKKVAVPRKTAPFPKTMVSGMATFVFVTAAIIATLQKTVMLAPTTVSVSPTLV